LQASLRTASYAPTHQPDYPERAHQRFSQRSSHVDIRLGSRLLADGACGGLDYFFEVKGNFGILPGIFRHFAGNIWADETLYGVIYEMKLFGAGDE
jgi:hypothetical protein